MVNDDPRAPYKVYEGDERKGTYATRFEPPRVRPLSSALIAKVCGGSGAILGDGCTLHARIPHYLAVASGTSVARDCATRISFLKKVVPTAISGLLADRGAGAAGNHSRELSPGSELAP